MKLLHVITSMDPCAGGPCQGIRNLAPIAQRKGHTVEMVCLDDPASDYLAHENLPVHALGERRSSWGYHPALKPWLEKNLPRFDAIILNGLWQYPGFVLSRLAQRPSMPAYFVFAHGMLDPWFQKAPDRRLKAIRNWFYWKLIEKNVIRHAEAILFTCAEEMRLAGQTFRPYEPKNEVNVGYGVGDAPGNQPGMQEAFAAKCPGLERQPYFLFLGRIHRKKGVDLLIRAYAKIYHAKSTGSQPAPTAPCLVIAGPASDTAYLEEMQALAATLCPSGTVFWPGMLIGDAKWGALYHCNAFVLPSHQENFGIAIVEALACGKPVLISNQINIWQEIKADSAGFVTDDTLAGAEQLFLQWKQLSDAEKTAMGRTAKASFENRFGIALASKNLLATIEDFTGKRRQSR